MDKSTTVFGMGVADSGQEHYFTSRPLAEDEVRPISVRLAGSERALVSAPGIFSPDGIDKGTQILLDAVPAPAPRGNLLDIGAGWGPIALTLALRSPDATVWAVDVNERCLALTERNAASLGLSGVRPATPDEVPEDLRFETIWSNPPIRIGKSELHGLLLRWLPRLAPGGSAWLVVQKNLGSDSLQRWLDAELGEEFQVSRETSVKSFRILKVRRLSR